MFEKPPGKIVLHLEQLVADLESGLRGEGLLTDGRHEDASAARRVDLDAERLHALFHVNPPRLPLLRSAARQKLISEKQNCHMYTPNEDTAENEPTKS